jgi:hypothetical protein
LDDLSGLSALVLCALCAPEALLFPRRYGRLQVVADLGRRALCQVRQACRGVLVHAVRMTPALNATRTRLPSLHDALLLKGRLLLGRCTPFVIMGPFGPLVSLVRCALDEAAPLTPRNEGRKHPALTSDTTEVAQPDHIHCASSCQGKSSRTYPPGSGLPTIVGVSGCPAKRLAAGAASHPHSWQRWPAPLLCINPRPRAWQRF